MASSSLVFSPLSLRKTLALSHSKTPSLSLLSLSSSSLKLHAKHFSISLPFHQSSKGVKNFGSSRFVRNVAVSSEYEQDEDVLSDEGEPNFSPDLKLFVGNLPFTVDSAALAGLFGRAGNVEMVEVIYDKVTGRSRGFGFVTMSTVEEVEAAAQQFNGYELDGRPLRVNFGPPPPKEDGPRGGRGASSYGSRDGGGYGSRDGGGYGSRERSSYGSRDGGSSYGSRDGGSSYGSREGGSSYGARSGGSSYGGSRGGGSDSSNRVYVGNLSWGVDDMALETLFSEQGKVMEAKVVYDRDSGKSRGFGFVTYGSSDEVNSAIESLDGVDLNGRSIRVTVAEARPPRRQF